MNPIAKMLIEMAKFYGYDLAERQLEMYVDVLSQFNRELVLKAGKQYVLNPKNTKFPIPPHAIMSIYGSKESDPRQLAIDVARKIERAITKHGWNWQGGFFHEAGNYWETTDGKVFRSFKEAVLEELGEVGWHAVCSRGGWANLCKSSNEMEEGQFHAQLRDQVQSSYSLALNGVDVAKIEMPKPKSELESTKNILALIKPKDIGE